MSRHTPRNPFCAAFALEELYVLTVALDNGRMDGRYYFGACSCVIGTISNFRYMPHETKAFVKGATLPHEFSRYCIGQEYADMLITTKDAFHADVTRPAEEFVSLIFVGETPQNNPAARALRETISEIIAQKEREAHVAN